MKNDYDVVSVGKETIPHRKVFSPEEIEKMQGEHTRKLLDADKKCAELKALKAVKQGEIKDIYESALVLRNEIAAGSKAINVECYLVPDFDKGMMNYVDADKDEVVFSRRLTPDERQLRENKLRVVGEA